MAKDGARFYVRTDAEAPERGPFSRKALREAVAARRVRASSLVRRDGTDEWIAIDDVIHPRRSPADEEFFGEKDIEGLHRGLLHRWGPLLAQLVGAVAIASLAWLYVDGARRIVIVIPIGLAIDAIRRHRAL